MNYFPLAVPFLIAFFLLAGIFLVLIEIGVLGYAYERIGVDRRYVFALLFLSLFGSYINIPLFRLAPEEVYSYGRIFHAGMMYVVPRVTDWPGTLVAVNVGGALVPAVLSVYLMVKNQLLVKGLIGTAVATAIMHTLAHPVQGVGIAIPTFIPPLAACFIALILSRASAPALAYIVGSLGTLIGADLLNLGKIQGLGAPVASIGGAGTFDGIFFTGILAVLLASIMIREKPCEVESHRAYAEMKGD